jgi:adenylate kinase family enzyme
MLGDRKHAVTSHERAPSPAERVPGRVVVIGTSGAGKSTLGVPLAGMLGAAYTELDRFQHGPNWTPAPPEVFRERVLAAAGAPRWVFDGNYIDRIADDLWPRAELIVWLNPPLLVILLRLLRRSLKRIILRTELWQGNREGWGAIFGRESVLGWAVRSNRRHVRELPGRLAALAAEGAETVRLRSGAQARDWLQGMDARIRARVKGSVNEVGRACGGVLEAEHVLPIDCATGLAATFPKADRVDLVDRGEALPGIGSLGPAWQGTVDGLLETQTRNDPAVRVLWAYTQRLVEQEPGTSGGAGRSGPALAVLVLRFQLGSGHGLLTAEFAAGLAEGEGE